MWCDGPNLKPPDSSVRVRRINPAGSGLRRVHLPPHGPELRPAETTRTPVEELVVDTPIPDLDALVDIMALRCCDLTERQSDISPHANFAWWPKDHAPSLGPPASDRSRAAAGPCTPTEDAAVSSSRVATARHSTMLRMPQPAASLRPRALDLVAGVERG